MKREDRLEAMGAAERGALVRLADAVLETLPVTVERGPSVGLLMTRVQEPAEGVTFNFVEVTVTEVEVSARGQRGYAMCLGREPERALAAAVLDVAVEVAHPLSDDIDRLLARSRQAEAEQWARRWAEVAPTVVRFEDVT